MENIKLYFRKGSGREILFEQRESRQNIKKYGDLDSETWRKRNESIRRVYSPEGIAPTTPTAQGGGVMTKIVEEGAKTGLYWSCDTNVKIVGNIYDSQGENGQVLDPSGISKTIKSGETNTKGNGGVGSSNSPKILEDMRIRRLTPVECERLMGLEDGWTSKGIIDGKEVDISDTQRYKMCGNGVVVNCVEYVYSLISKLTTK